MIDSKNKKVELSHEELAAIGDIIFPPTAYLICLAEENKHHVEKFHHILAEMWLVRSQTHKDFDVLDVAANLVNLDLPEDLFVAAFEFLHKNDMLEKSLETLFLLKAFANIPHDIIKRIFDGVISDDLSIDDLEERLKAIVAEVKSN